MRPTHPRLTSWIYAALFGMMATYHFFVLLDSEMSHVMVMRHAIFFAVDSAFALLLWQWPPWLLIPCAALMVQQLESHGGNVWRAWQHGEFDPVGVFTLAGLIVLVLLLTRDAIRRYRT